MTDTTLPDWWPESEEDYELARRVLKKRFAKWRADAGADADRDAGETPIHYKWAYLDGHLTRWICEDLDEIYLELVPAKVMVEDDHFDGLLDEAVEFICFLDETRLLDSASDPADMLLGHLDSIAKQFRHNMADDSRYSFGKRLWTTAQSEGVHIGDQASMDAFITNFNSRPIEEREAILGPGLPPRRTARFTPPGTEPKSHAAKRRRRRR